MKIILTPQIFNAKVMHKRLFPKENGFNYGVYYLCLPLKNLDKISDALSHNKFGLVSFYNADHGEKDGTSPENWVKKILNEKNLDSSNLNITLICLPRVLGYVFNPVSFYLCFDDATQKLKFVIYEVNNTFGETHTYITYNKDGSEVTGEQYLEAEKLFHVSPFLEREGHYKFRFDLRDDKLGIWIDFYDASGNKKLITSLIGKFSELTKQSIKKAFWQHPLVTLKTIFLIHYQAMKLIFKGIKYIPKPQQKKERVTNNR